MRISLGQLLVEGGEPDRNLERAATMVEAASAAGSDLILLPETLDFAWTHPSALEEAEPIPGRFSNELVRLAKEHRIMICAGLTEKGGDRNFNTALLIDRDGEILLKYRKINLLDVEWPYYEIGTELAVVDTEHGRLGLNICADNYIDGLSIGHTLARMGAELIVSPSSWTSGFEFIEGTDPYKDKWMRPFLTLSKLYRIHVASCTSVGYIVGGPYEGKKMIGRSLLVGPRGVVAEGPFNEFAGELVHSDIDLQKQTLKGTAFGQRLNSIGFRHDDAQWPAIERIQN
jgi:predicted amidohydrolase